MPGVTFSPGLSYWPRIRMNVSRGLAISSITIVLGTAASRSSRCFFSFASSSASLRASAETFLRK